MTTLPKGTRLESFSIAGVLGQGGFGITYLATDETLDRRVAIKEYFPQSWASRDGTTVSANSSSKGDYVYGLDSFINEAKTLARFKHSSIVHVNRIIEANGTAYMVLEYQEGHDFGTWLENLGRAPTQSELDAIAGKLLDALSVIHANNFLHRDIAPDNIYIRDDGTPVLLDFGSAREALEKRTKTLTGFIKRGYSPLEQRSQSSKHQGPWTDIYAVGATLYRAIAGIAPQDAQDRLLEDELISAFKIGQERYRDTFLAAVNHALALHHTERPKTVAEWSKELLASTPTQPEGIEPTVAPRERVPDTSGLDEAAKEQRARAQEMMRRQLAKERADRRQEPASRRDENKQPSALDSEAAEQRNEAQEMRRQLAKERQGECEQSASSAPENATKQEPSASDQGGLSIGLILLGGLFVLFLILGFWNGS